MVTVGEDHFPTKFEFIFDKAGMLIKALKTWWADGSRNVTEIKLLPAASEDSQPEQEIE
jgi:hypothetical protein